MKKQTRPSTSKFKENYNKRIAIYISVQFVLINKPVTTYQAMKLLECSKDDRIKILAFFNRTPESIQEDINAIKEWFKKQPHLPETPRDWAIETFLLLSKCSIEVTKQKLDMYYTIRSLLPEMYNYINPNSEQMKATVDYHYYLPLPKQTKDLYRVNVFKMATSDPDKFFPYQFFGYTLNIAEIRVVEDRTIGDIIICDMTGCTLGHLSKITPIMVKKAVTVMETVFTTRMHSMHYVNCPPFTDRFVRLVKGFLKPKVAERIFVHKDLETLYKEIPREILPKDLCGDEMSLAELNELWKKKFEEYKGYFDHLDQIRVDESLRPGQAPDADLLFGCSGNFKKLDVD